MSLKISIITPSFNQAQFLRDNLDSVRRQSHAQVEHIIVDPGSTDGSREIAQNATGIRLIAEPDRGQSDGICKGFAQSTGDVLTWLNSDDYYPTDRVLETVARTFDENPEVDIIYGNVTFVDEVGAELRKGFVNQDTQSLLESFQYQVGIVQPGVFMRRSVFDEIGGPSDQYEYCMDYEYWVRMATHGLRWHFVDELFALHRWWGGMKTSKGRDQSLIEHMRVCDDYFGYIHWKWLDRYAEYLTSNEDGVVNHSQALDVEEKARNAQLVVRRFVTQTMAEKLAASEAKELKDTYEFVLSADPEFQRYFFEASDINGLVETCSEPHAFERRAWHLFDAKSADGKQFCSYKVPDNFHRCFDSDWYGKTISDGREQLSAYSRNKKSQTCVIVANGPSLNESDLSLLESVDVIISNFATLNEDLLKFASFLTVTNTLVAEQGAVAFNSLKTPKVLPFWLAHQMNATPETCFVNATVKPKFGASFDGEFSWRSTVSFFNMQLAYALGYEKVILIGFDHSYVQPESVAEGDEIHQSEDDGNHFDPRYFKGKTWQAADTVKMEEMYRVAKEAFDRGGREIVNCTVGGKLEVFRRGDLATEIASPPITHLIQTDANESPRWDEYVKLKQSRLPDFLQSSIFLPTDRIAPKQKIAGAKKVIDLYAGKLEDHKKTLADLRRGRQRDRCFIIGNGPSLNKLDLSRLKGEDTFAVNGFFLKMDELDWHPTYYVVEDHLVAEDRAAEINQITGPTKLFPAYLAYCLPDQEDVVYFDHRPRPGYPDGFRFSLDASDVTYSGCTVTFTCMQLAFFLGYKEVYLIGVDADYDIPNDVERSDSYSTTVLDMGSDDINHFHPDYFGKGYRWHDPQVSEMLAAYREAKSATAAKNFQIINATFGGKLELFPRRPYQDIFAQTSTSASALDTNTKSDHPRILVIDHTAIGNGTATGELKGNIFGDWPNENYLQLCSLPSNGASLISADGSIIQSGVMQAADAQERLLKFDPEIILYRTVPDTTFFHALAMSVIESFEGTPLAVWIMDDWPARIEREDAEQHNKLDPDWRNLVSRASVRLSIGTKMSDIMQARYGETFLPFANGVVPSDWPLSNKKRSDRFVIRYAGSIAQNMTANSILRVARAVETLAENGLDIAFEIHTKPIWREQQSTNFSGLSHTFFSTEQLTLSEYREWISDGDSVLIAYNFDDASLEYVGSSIANKMPECLASGVPLLVHGPVQSATVSYLKEMDCAVIVDAADAKSLTSAIRYMATNPDKMQQLSDDAREVAFKKHNIIEIRRQFADTLSKASNQKSKKLELRDDDMVPLEIPRSRKAHLDETQVVAELLKDRTGRDRIMLDVGAHFGTSAQYFSDLGWTIHCFEPDANNRAKLKQRFQNIDRVSIDSRAVSHKSEKDVPFFTSGQSTGISGLHAFHETHQENGLVDITTIAAIIDSNSITKVDFLKIDVEGFDLNVLKGVPWEVLKPDVVECEFEDSKTLPLGHDWKTIADYLCAHGYTVYVSEWHPIVQYGIPHDWRRVFKYPSFDMGADAWGNLLAFRVDPGSDAVESAFNSVLSFRRVQQSSSADRSGSNHASEVGNGQAPESESSMLKVTTSQSTEVAKNAHQMDSLPSAGSKWYSEPAHRIRNRSQRLFSALRFSRRAAAHILTRPWLAVPSTLAVAVTLWFIMDPRFSGSRPWLILAMAGVLLMVFTAYIAFRAFRHIELLQEQNAQQSNAINVLNEQMDQMELMVELEAEQFASQHVIEAMAKSVKPNMDALSTSLAKLSAKQIDAQNVLEDVWTKMRAQEQQGAQLSEELSQQEATISERLDIVAEHSEQLVEQATQLYSQNSKLSQHDAQLEDISDKLDNVVPNLEQTLSAKISDVVAETESVKAAYDARLVAVDEAVLQQSNKYEEMAQNVGEFSTELTDAIEMFNETSRWAAHDNALWYQHFNRKLLVHHVELFKTEWQKKLLIPIEKQLLGYMAMRACDIERRLDGRLATSVEDILLRTLVARSVKSPSLEVLEIGTLFGTGAAIMFDALAPHFEKTHFTLLDPLDGYYNRVNADLLTGQIVNEKTVTRNLTKAGLEEDNFELIKHLSTDDEAQNAVKDRAFDVLIIDGDHSYAGVKTDFENYVQTVKLGGYIIIDDYGSPDWPDVKEYVDRELEQNSNIARVGASWRTCIYRVVKNSG